MWRRGNTSKSRRWNCSNDRRIKARMGSLVAFIAAYAGMDTLFWATFVAGMACHWRFWRLALPVWFLCAVIGWKIGGKHRNAGSC